MNEQHTMARTPIGFKFLNLPSELRNMIYELVLVRKKAVWAWFRDRKEPYSPGLLRASRLIHREASSIFYSRNRFDFVDASPTRVAAFLQQIGPNNAAYIQHVSILFPYNFRAYLSDVYCADVHLNDRTMAVFNSVRSNCVNLSSLTAFLEHAGSMEHLLEEGDDDPVLEALDDVADLFRLIPSLPKITVETLDDPLNDYTQEIMESYGWKTSTI
jgi:hypothetical protein